MSFGRVKIDCVCDDADGITLDCASDIKGGRVYAEVYCSGMYADVALDKAGVEKVITTLQEMKQAVWGDDVH